jgi:hypothetical protein
MGASTAQKTGEVHAPNPHDQPIFYPAALGAALYLGNRYLYLTTCSAKPFEESFLVKKSLPYSRSALLVL